MSQKAVEKARAHASAVVPPGETVRHAVPVQIWPKIAYAVGLLGPLVMVFVKHRTVAVTDAALYVMSQKAVERRVPLGSVPVRAEKGPGSMSMTMGALVIDGEKMLFTKRPCKEEADELAAAARVT